MVVQTVVAGPVNLPPEGLPGVHRPLRKQGSYQWLMEACEDQASDVPAAERGRCSCSAPYLGLPCSFEVCKVMLMVPCAVQSHSVSPRVLLVSAHLQ